MPLEALPSKGIIFVLYQGNNNEWNAVYYRYSVLHVLVYTYSYDTLVRTGYELQVRIIRITYWLVRGI